MEYKISLWTDSDAIAKLIPITTYYSSILPLVDDYVEDGEHRYKILYRVHVVEHSGAGYSSCESWKLVVKMIKTEF